MRECSTAWIKASQTGARSRQRSKILSVILYGKRTEETSDDHANYYGSIKHLKKAALGADMSQIEDAMDGLMTAIRNGEEFIRYQAIKEKVYMAFQNWKARITEFS